MSLSSDWPVSFLNMRLSSDWPVSFLNMRLSSDWPVSFLNMHLSSDWPIFFLNMGLNATSSSHLDACLKFKCSVFALKCGFYIKLKKIIIFLDSPVYVLPDKNKASLNRFSRPKPNFALCSQE